jgi:hypothetical protein
VLAFRPYCKGYLKLSFVSCPIALYSATSAAERVSFRQVNRRTGHRLRQKLVDSVTGEAVDSSNKARGYEVGENEFLLVEDRDLERARSASRRAQWNEPSSRESLPTVPAGFHEQNAEKAAADNHNEVIAPSGGARSTHAISRNHTTSRRATRPTSKRGATTKRGPGKNTCASIVASECRRTGVRALAKAKRGAHARHPQVVGNRIDVAIFSCFNILVPAPVHICALPGGFSKTPGFARCLL